MCPEVPRYVRRDLGPPSRPDSGFTEREKRAFPELAKHQLNQLGKARYFGQSIQSWMDQSPHGVFCPIGDQDSEFFPFWVDTQVIGVDEPEVLVWWLCKLGRLPFQYHRRKVAKERVTNMVGLGSAPTRAWLRGFGTISLSRGQVEQVRLSSDSLSSSRAL